MNQPVFWVSLVVIAVVAMGLRLRAGRPLWQGRTSEISAGEMAVAGVMAVALIFHCAAMFFAGWVDAVPFAEGPAAAVRDLDGRVSQVAYWVPALGLVIALRRVWLPALVLLIVTLVGVGYTMFVPHGLTTHLAWIAAATIALVTIVAGLISRAGSQGRLASQL
jgi:hypothetical protein